MKTDSLGFKDLFIYFRERKRTRAGGGAEGERENPQADSRLIVEPHTGLNPRTLRS